MQSANDATTAVARHGDCFFIDGKWIEPSSADRIEVIDSASEKPFASVAAAAAADIDRAVGAARQAFDHGPWPRLSHKERAGYLRALAAGMRERADELAEMWTRQAGMVYSVSQYAARAATGAFDITADLADTFAFEEPVTVAPGQTAVMTHEPVGVVAAIIPWNSPSVTIGYKAAPALLAGCTVVLKLSPEAPGEGYVIAEIAEKIGLPPGVLNVVTADRPVSELLVSDPRVDKVTFTGSTAAGRRINAVCAERSARVTLELGGKSPAVILDDFDLKTAAARLAETEFRLSGQVCGELSRIIVTKDRHDELVAELVAAIEPIRVGDPFDPGVQMGPLVSAAQRDRVEGYIARGVADGATLACGGTRPTGVDTGYYVMPTVLANVDNASVVAQEEIFGPVLCVIPAENEEDAVAIANDTMYGLNASVFTNDRDRARKVASQLKAGTVAHNTHRGADFGTPWGGFKGSGFGREGGREGLLPFLEVKTVLLEDK